MGKRTLLSREARRFIMEQVKEDGLVTVSAVAALVSPMYEFDPKAAREREIADYSRRLMRTVRDTNGARSLLAVRGEPGLFVDLDSCTNVDIAQRIDHQLAEKLHGLTVTRTKALNKACELAGQIAFDTVKGEN